MNRFLPWIALTLLMTGCQSSDPVVESEPVEVSQYRGMTAGGISLQLPREDPWVPKGTWARVQGRPVWVPQSNGSAKRNSRYGPVSGSDAMEQVARYSMVHQFEASAITLEEALEQLRGRSSEWARTFGYAPLHISTRYSLKRQPVTLSTRNSSFHSICQMLADQVGGELEYRDGMIYISGCSYHAEY